MDIRLRAEELERRIMSPYACLSSASKGRERQEEECSVRTCFQRDRDRILHSKSFRRLKHKTQVFTIPEGDHYRTRLTHTLEVAQIARTISRALRLNEDLTEAIALGHDLGHTPFGHAGEDALNEVMEAGFKHNHQSLRVVDVLEGRGGLNLTYEVRDGILNHTGDVRPATLEGQVVRIADRVAYINHDIDDAIRGGILTIGDLPKECLAALGLEHRNRINTMVLDLIQNNWEEPYEIKMSPAIQLVTEQLRNFLFTHVYVGSDAKREETKTKHVVQKLFYYFLEHCEALPEEYYNRLQNVNPELVICDYIAGMTDRFAIRYFQKTFLPLPWAE